MTTTLRPPTGPDLGTEPETEHGNRHAWVLVMTREIVVRAMNRAFLVSLAVSVALVGGLTVFFAWESSRTTTYTVAVAAQDDVAVAAVEAVDTAGQEQQPPVRAEVLQVDDDAAARSALTEGDADAWLHPATPASDGWVLAADGAPSTTLTAMLTTAVSQAVLSDNAAQAGTTWEALSVGTEVITADVGGGPETGPGSPVWIVGFVFALLFFSGAVGSGAMIASSVVEEKQSRLVEILAVSVPLRHLLAGKILGSSVIALGQNVVLAAVGLVGMSFTPLALELPGLSRSVLLFVLFFAVGFVAVAAVYAAGGALASRMEDVGSTTGPVAMLLMLVYFATFMAEGTFERVLSYVPLASVVAMPNRVLGGDAAWWEPVVSLLVLLAFAGVALLVSERAYRGALLQTGGRMSWRTALRAEG